MTFAGAVRVGVWLTVAGLWLAACDVIQNKKFPPPGDPPGGPVGTPGGRPTIFGVGGGKSDGTGYGGYGGLGGYGGFGGYGGGRAVRPDGGMFGLGGAPGISCGVSSALCLPSCYVETAFSSSPICDPARGAWTCLMGQVLSSTCPAGACATTFLYCCDTASGAREPAGCTQNGYRGQCPANYDSLTEDSCIPNGLAVPSCSQLHGKPCSSANLQCHSGGFDCSCVKGDGGLVWSCPSLI